MAAMVIARRCPWIRTNPIGGLLGALFGALVLCALAAAGHPLAQDFLSTVDDVPVMPGLTEMPEAGFVFDKPDGRIAEAAARGRVTREAVLAFYGQTLPQLGWSRAAPDRFRRIDEGLVLSFAREGTLLVVRFQVAPLAIR